MPEIGSPAYHLMLSLVSILVLGPLGGISGAFMNFSIGFFVGGQVLAGILGSAVTLPYGPEGKHGANYMQTMAASVANMCAMAVLIQARHWLGLPEVEAWRLVAFYCCIGMFGTGVGMLYTPVVVDRMQLTYPSGFAVANILRALTDPVLLRRSLAKLGGGVAVGYVVGYAALKSAAFGLIGLSSSTVGAGMVVGARVAVPAMVVAIIGHFTHPYLVEIGWLHEADPFRKIGFIIALGTILGAAVIDVGLILREAYVRLQKKTGEPAIPVEDWKQVNVWRLIWWTLVWAVAVVTVGHWVMGEPTEFLVVAVLLSFLFVLVNGISLGISDANPISSSFVLGVFILASIGLTGAGTGLMCASILLIACSVGGDMQQDRSTGWRLGTNRITQFRYQMIGIVFGSVFAVILARIFLQAFPVLKLDQFGHEVPGAQLWQSAMTYKFVGALRGITGSQPHILKALWLGIGIGLVTEVIRKLTKQNAAYQKFSRESPAGRVTDFIFDAVVMPSPYASSFGGFVDFLTAVWWTVGGIASSLFEEITSQKKSSAADPLPADMSTMSLIGGGLIAGDSLAALTIGITGLVSTVF